MPTKFGTSEYWHERAKEARAVAEGIKHPEGRRAMLPVAGNYEELAKQAEPKGTASRHGWQ